MTLTLIAALVILLLLTFIILEIPIAVALLLSSVLGVLLIRGDDAGLGALGALPFNAATSYSLAAIPMFILMGTLASEAGPRAGPV